MFRTTLIMIFSSLSLFGGLLDFKTLEKAKDAYGEGHYKESAAAYGSLDHQNDEVHYNLGNAYYKEKEYKKAIAEFKQVNTPELKAKALHNLGNSYAQSKKRDEAIAAYEEALKLGDDADTKFNLELLKKQKQQQQKQNKKDQKKNDKKNKKKKDQNKKDQQNQKKQNKDQQNKDQKDQKKKSDKNDKDKKNKQSDQQKSDQQKKDEQKKKEQEKKAEQKKAKEDKKSKEDQKKRDSMKQTKAKPISDMQERKYEKMLDKRGIKTLMVPLKTKGGEHEETTAW